VATSGSKETTILVSLKHLHTVEDRRCTYKYIYRYMLYYYGASKAINLSMEVEKIHRYFRT
jgi:hypothetical protein